MDFIHFKNFLGPPGETLCGVRGVDVEIMTLDPAKVTCERCMALLGRVRDANLGLPPKPKGDS